MLKLVNIRPLGVKVGNINDVRSPTNMPGMEN